MANSEALHTQEVKVKAELYGWKYHTVLGIKDSASFTWKVMVEQESFSERK